MKLAFCAVVAKDLSDDDRNAVIGVLGLPSAAAGIRPNGHLDSRGSGPAGPAQLGVWFRSFPDENPPTAGRGAEPGAWYCGHPLPTSAHDLSEIVSNAPITELPSALCGVYAVVRFSSDRVQIAPDPAGYEVVYVCETPEACIASNRPELVAGVLEAIGRAPALDVESICLLAHTGFHDGRGGPYRGVARLAPWSWCELGSRGITAHPYPGRPPWRTATAVTEADFTTSLTTAEEAILGAVRQAGSLRAADRIVDVTGGRDSRLVLAAVHRAGLGGAFIHRTIGGADLGDVARAAEVCEHFGVAHSFGYPHPKSALPFPVRFEAFVEATRGRSNAFDLHDVGRLIDEVRLQGLGGELLRTGLLKKPDGMKIPSVAGHLAQAFRVDEGDFLLPDAKAQARQRFLADVYGADDDPITFVDADDVSQNYYATVRLRARLEQIPEFWPTQNVWPLYTDAVMRYRSIGRALGRSPDEIHSRLLQRVLPEAEAIPYLDVRPHVRDPAPIPPGGSALTSPSLMQVLMAEQIDERRPFLEHLVDGGSNLAWEYLDRDAVRAAVHDLSALSQAAQRRLYGALTAISALS